jgi:ribulose-5-phosphate 4-epimerase/fuculose-1-phosphate aldolase
MAQTKSRSTTNLDAGWQARVDLAAALRVAVHCGFHEGICNHFSLAVPGEKDRFLLNPWGMHWSEVRASDLVVVDSEGKLIAGAAPPEPTAFYIHARIHVGNPKASCVLHTHMPYATAIAHLQNGRIEWIGQASTRFYGNVAYYDDYNGLVLDNSEGDRICEALGDKRVLFLANHGVIVVGETVARAFDDLYYLERVCQNQVIAMQTGRPLRHLSQEVLDHIAAQRTRDVGAVSLHFASLKRGLDRKEPDYAD